MKLASNVSQFVRIFVTAAAFAGGVTGCAASGSDTGTGGAGSGGGGTSGTACTVDDVNLIFKTTTTNLSKGCTVVNACHDAAGSSAGLDLASVGWQDRLVGKAPTATAGTASKSKCAGMGLVYLNAHTTPATGLFLDKLNPAKTPPCGDHMPNLGVMLSPQEFACVQSFANTLTK